MTTLFLRLLCLGMTGTVHAAVLDDFSTVTAWSPGEPDRYAGKIEQVPGGAVVTPLKDTWGFVARRFSFTAEQVRTTPYLVVHVSKIEGKGLLVLKVITPDLQKDFVATAQKPGSYGGNLAESFRGLKKPLHLDVRLYAMGPKVRAHVSRLTLETTLPANAPLVWPAWTMPEDSRRVNGVWLHWEEGQAGIAKQPDPVPDEKVMTAIRVSPVEVDRRGALADIPEGGWIGQIGDSSVRAIIGEQRSHTRRLLAPRRALSLARAWRYHAGDSHGASLPVSKSSPQPNALYSFSSLVWPGQPLWAQTDWDDSAWQEVNVPTVVAEEWDESSFGWYRLRFRLPKDVRSVEQLRFDAVSAVAQVWLNGRYLGRQQNYHPSRLGWNRWPWCFDAADALELDDVNTLAVRTWMSGPQGIPGDVYLIEGSPGHVASIRVKRSNVRDDLTADYDFHLRLAEATGPLHARGEIRDLAGK
ncbi:MAG: hypothetical protein QF473_15480, partial [Planctomycetota bacterium]|nr:hypothetical protein [Planctomycetota bacterium]